MPRPKRKTIVISSVDGSTYVDEWKDCNISTSTLADYLADLELRIANIEAHLEWQATQRRGARFTMTHWFALAIFEHHWRNGKGVVWVKA